MNEATKEDLVQVVQLGGKERLWYKVCVHCRAVVKCGAWRLCHRLLQCCVHNNHHHHLVGVASSQAPHAIHIALLRGTTADTAGNISFEREPLFLDQLYQAMAAHNSGGKVVVQVERVVAAGSIPSRGVHIPGALVDKVADVFVIGLLLD